MSSQTQILVVKDNYSFLRYFSKPIFYTSVFILVLFSFFSLNTNRAEAATRTWTGTTSGSWSVAGNWGGTAPVTGDNLVFPVGASNLSNTNDFTENTIFNSITLSGSGYTLSGNPIILGAALAGLTDSVASGGNTIALDIRLDITRDIEVTNTAETLTISGRITGVGGFNKEGTGKLILSGANTYGGITKINVGVVNARNNTSLGTIAAGTQVVGGAVLELQGTINISYEALTLRGYGVSTGGALRNVSDNNTFGGLITLDAGGTGGTEIASDSGTLTLTGGMTGAFALIIDGAGNVTFSKTPIATGAGIVTKNGAGTLTYNFPNTYTGLTTVNAGTLLYGVDNAILSGNVTVNGGTLDIATFSDMVGAVLLGTVDLASGTITGSSGILSSSLFTVNSGTISAIIAGNGGILNKATSGTVTLTRANQYTGATTISTGILEIQDSLSLGLIDTGTSITAGATLQINGTGLSIPEYIALAGTGHLYTGAIRNKTGSNTLTGLITIGAASMIESDTGTTLTIDSKGISATTFGLTIGGEGNTIFTSTAPIYGTTATLTKTNGGTLTMQAFNNFTGATNINGGQIILSGSGAMPLSTTMTISAGATLTLDNTSSTTVVDRIADTLALTMNGGNFNFIGSSSINTDETSGALTAGIATQSGHNIITVTPGSGGSTTMQFASFARTAGASVLFRGTSFGVTPASNVSTLLFSTPPTLVGAFGAANSTTISIIAGAFGDNSLSGTGTDMVTYGVGNSNGLRLLNGAGFSGEYASNFATTNANVKLTASTAGLTSSINSLILSGSGAISNPGSGQVITIGSAVLSGNILNTVASATIAGANTTIAGGSVELMIHTSSALDISALITTTGGLTKSGAGTLTFSTAKTYTGLTSVNQGTLLYGINDAISSGAVTVNGGTLDIATFTDTVGAVILQSGTITGSTGVLTSSASYNFREGTVSAIIAGSTIAVTRIATNTAADSVVTLTRNNTYTGATTITSGILKIDTCAACDSTNSQLGTIAGATVIAGLGALDLNGITLSTAEPINTMTGLGFGPGATVALGNSNMGALMNSSGTPVSYSGAITLAAASRINADYGALTISSAISGAFVLTIGGFSDSTFSGVLSTITGVTKDGIGTLTLSNAGSSYAGVTTVSMGTLKLGINGGATNTPFGIAGAGNNTLVSVGARLDLNGFQITSGELLSLNGTGYGLGDFASGALINSSVTGVTWPGAITLVSATTIKANSGDMTLSGGISGALALTLGGTGNTIISGAITTVTTVTKIDTGITTLSSASNSYAGLTSINLGTIKLGASAGATNTPLGTNVAGTTVYSGAVLDLNGFTMTTTEAITINGRGINDGGALIGSNGTLGGTVAQGTDSRITNASGTMTITGAVSGAFSLYVGGAGNITTSAVFPAVALAITKQGAGTLTVTGANLYTGETRIDAGTFAYAATGTTTLVATNLLMKGGTFNNSNNADTIGTVTLIEGTITNSVALTAATSYTLESGTISGIIAGAVPITKNTNNTVTLTGVDTVSSTAVINAGTLTISGSGSAVSVTAITVNLGGTLTLDNSATAVASRILDTLVLTMNGGNFNFIGNTAALSAETMGQLALSSGHNVVTVTPGAGGSTTLTFGAATNFSRTAGATVLFRGTSFGATPAANVSTLMFTTGALTLTGVAGAANSTTASVLKGAFGDNSLSGTGSDMVTYNLGNTNGLRLLNGAGFAGEYAGDLATANANVKLTADRAAVATNTNSLILNGFNITNPGGAVTIPMSAAALAGNVLINSATNIAGANTTLGITTFELNVLATANSTISATIGTATTGLVSFSGTGNVTLSAANAYTGITYVNGATLTAGASNVLSSGGVTMKGGLYNLNGNSDTIGALSLTGSTVTTGAGTLTLGGTFTTVANANVASIVTGKLDLGAARIFDIADGLMDEDAVISAVISGAFAPTKSTGTGVLVFSGSNTYTGLTTISAGVLRLGAAGDATNTPLGTTAAGTTVGTGAGLDLNGFTLGTTEGLTLNSVLATGALQNTSSTAVSYSGLVVLTASSFIISNYGDINITNTGNITGTGFTLTIGGSGNGSLASNLNTSTSGALTKNGLGLWTISGGASTYTGLTTISAGTLKLGSAGSGSNTPLGTVAGGITITSGAIFDINGFTLATAEPIGSLNGTGLANIGAFINSSNNTFSFTGAITLGAASRMANYGSGTFSITGALAGAFALTMVTAPGTINQNTGAWAAVAGAITKEGSGTAIISGQHQFTGAVTVSTGTLQLGGAGTGSATSGPFGTIAGGVTVSAGAVLDLSTFTANGASTWEPLTLSGSGLLNGGALISNSVAGSTFATLAQTNARIVNNGAGALVLTGAVTGGSTFWVGGSGPTSISGALNTAGLILTKYGAGTLTLSSAVNINTSLVRINAGTLAYGVADALSTPPITVAGGTLNLAGFNETNIGQVTLIDGSIVNTGGAASLVSTAAYAVENGTISAILGGPAIAFNKNTGGTVTLSGANTFAGTTTINAGTLTWGANDTLSTGDITVTGGFANLATFTDTVGTVTLTSGGITSSTGILTGTSYVMQSGTVSAILAGAVAFPKTTTGTVALSRANTFTGTTTITAGILRANSSSALGDGSGTNTLIFNGGTLQAGGDITSPSPRAVTLSASAIVDTNGYTVSFAGTVGSTGGLGKNGIGTLTTSGAVTLGAGLTVLNGTFNQASSLNMTAGAVAVATSGVWSNVGTGAVTLAGTVTNSGTITLNSNNGTQCVDGADSILLRSSVNNTLRAWSSGTTGTGTFNLYNLDVDDMSGTITVYTSTKSGDTTWTAGSCGISISGTSNGTGTVKLAINGVLAGQTAVIGGGTWSASNVTISSDQILVAWIDAVADGAESTAIGKYDGAGDMTGMVLNANVLSIGSVDNQSLTLTNLDPASIGYDCTDNEDVMYSVASSTLSVQGVGCAGGANSYTNETLQIESGDTLTLSGTENLTTENLTVTGTLNATTTGTINLQGSGTPLTVAGVFTPSTSTVEYSSVASPTITNMTYNNLKISGTINAVSETATVAGIMTVTGTFTPSAGTITMNTGSSLVNLVGSINFANLSIANSATVTSSGGGFAISGNFTLGTSATFTPAPADIISGAGTLLGSACSYIGNTCPIVKVTRTTATADFLSQYTIANKTYTNLIIDYTNVAQSISNSFTYGGLRVSAALTGATTVSVASMFSTTAAFAPSAGTITMLNGSIMGFNVAPSLFNLTIPSNATVISAFSGSNFTIASGGTFTVNSGATFTPGTLAVITGTGATLTGSGTVQVTLSTGATKDFNTQYNFTTKTLDNLTVEYSTAGVSINNLTYGTAGAGGLKISTSGVTSTASATIGGVFTVNVTWTHGSGTFTMNSGSSMVISNGPIFFNLTTANFAGNISSSGSFAVSGTFTVGSGSTFTPTAGDVISGAGTLTGSGTVKVNTNASNALATEYSITTKTLTNLTVDYTGGASQTLSNTTYGGAGSGGLTISGSISTGANTATVGGVLTVGGSGVFTPSSGTITMNTGSSIANTGTLTFQALTIASGATVTGNTDYSIVGTLTNSSTGVFTSNAGTVSCTGCTITNSGTTLTFNNLTTTGTVTAGTSNNFTVSGNLNISSGTFTSNSNTLSVGGNFTNAGAFTHNSGTVALTTATTATVSGSNSFNNLSISGIGAAKIVQFTAGTTTTVVGTFTVAGTTGNLITLTSTTASPWTINPTSASADYVDVSYSTNTGVGFCATHAVSANGGNTSWNISSGAGCSVSISGTVYQSGAEGSAFNCSVSNITLHVSVNGGANTNSTCSASDGTFTFASVTDPSAANIPIVLFTDSAAAQKGTLVTLSAGAGANITGLSLFIDRVTVSQESGTAITNAHMATADNADAGIRYVVSGGNLTVESGIELHVLAAKTFTPGGNVTTTATATTAGAAGDVHVASGATLNMGSNALSVGGDFNNAGTYSYSGNTTTFTATGSGFSIEDGTNDFANVVFNGVGGGWSFSSAVNTIPNSGNITITNGTLSTTSNNISTKLLTVDGTLSGSGVGAILVSQGGVYFTGSGIVNLSGGSLEVNSALGCSGGALGFGQASLNNNNWVFNNLIFSNSSCGGNVGLSFGSQGSGSIRVNGVLTISKTGDAGGFSLNQNRNSTLILANAYDVSQSSGILNISDGTVQFNGTNTTINANTYNNLTLGGTSTYTLPASDITLRGNLVVTTGAIVTKSASNKLIFAIGGGGSQTITGNPTNSDLGIIQVSANVGNTTLNMGGSIKITSLTVDLSQIFSTGSNTLTLTSTSSPISNSGTFTTTGSTIDYTGNGVVIPNITYTNLGLKPSSTGQQVLSAGTYNISGNLTIGDGSHNGADASGNNAILNVTGNTTIANGATLTQGTGAFNFLGDVTLSNGSTFTKGAGTIVFKKGGGNTQTLTDSNTTKQDLGAVQISVNTGTTTLALGSSVKVTSMTIDNNQLVTLGSNTLELLGSGTPLTIGTGVTFTTTGSTVKYLSATTATVTGATFNNLTLGGTGTYTLPGADVTLRGDLLVPTGALVTKSASNKIIFAKGGGGTQTITDSTSGGQNLGIIQVSANSGNTNLTLNSNIIFTSATIDLNQTLNTGSNIVEFTLNTGTPLVTTGTFTPNNTAGKIIFNAGSGNTVNIPGNVAYYDLTIKGLGTFVPSSGTMTVHRLDGTTNTPIMDLNTNDPTLTVNADFDTHGDVLASSANPLTLKGNFAVQGSFTHNNGVVVLDPIPEVVLIKSATYYDLNNSTPGHRVNFAAGGNLIIDHQINFVGTPTDPIWIGSPTNGTIWYITFNTTPNGIMNFVVLSDVGCNAGQNFSGNKDHLFKVGVNNGNCWGFVSTGGGGIIGNTTGGGGSGGGGGDLPQLFVADDATALATYDSNWNVLSGAFAINTNSVYSNSAAADTMARWTPGAFSENQFSEMILSPLTSGSYVGVAVRAQAGAHSGYGAYSDTNNVKIIKRVAGTETVLYTGTAFADGDRIRLEMVGTTLTLKQNGAVITTVTDSAFSTGRPGIIGHGNATGARGDDFYAGSLAAQGGGGGGSSGEGTSGGGGGTLPQAFTGSDNVPLVTYDSSWDILNGAFAIHTNQIRSNSAAADTMARWTAGAFNDNQYSEIVIGALVPDNYVGVAVRAQAGAHSGYGAYSDGNNVKIIKRVAGTETVLYTGTAFSMSDRIRLEVSGTTLTLKQNGTVITTVTDSTFSAGKPGIIGHGNDVSVRADDFYADSLASQGGGGGGGGGGDAP